MENFKEELKQIRSLYNDLQNEDLNKMKLINNKGEIEISQNEKDIIWKRDIRDYEDYEQ
jgi:hypothetical protein